MALGALSAWGWKGAVTARVLPGARLLLRRPTASATPLGRPAGALPRAGWRLPCAGAARVSALIGASIPVISAETQPTMPLQPMPSSTVSLRATSNMTVVDAAPIR
jgi:hypothetical protein